MGDSGSASSPTGAGGSLGWWDGGVPGSTSFALTDFRPSARACRRGSYVYFVQKALNILCDLAFSSIDPSRTLHLSITSSIPKYKLQFDHNGNVSSTMPLHAPPHLSPKHSHSPSATSPGTPPSRAASAIHIASSRALQSGSRVSLRRENPPLQPRSSSTCYISVLLHTG